MPCAPRALLSFYASLLATALGFSFVYITTLILFSVFNLAFHRAFHRTMDVPGGLVFSIDKIYRKSDIIYEFEKLLKVASRNYSM